MLNKLWDIGFEDSFGFTLPPAAMRYALSVSPLVREVKKAVRHGQITEEEIRGFTVELTSQFQQGQRLPGDFALAALCVAVEDLPADFAEELLYKLARLNLAELGLSSRVARECLKHRVSLPKNEVRTKKYSKKRFIVVPRLGRFVAGSVVLQILVRNPAIGKSYRRSCGA
jgi:hypothetical protein